MEQLTGIELSAPIVSPQQMMLQACIKTVQNATKQHELEAQHLAVVETKRATTALLKKAKLILSRATSEKVKAKSSLDQLLGSPNKQFVEYERSKIDLTKTEQQPAVGTNGMPDDEAAEIDRAQVVNEMHDGPSESHEPVGRLREQMLESASLPIDLGSLYRASKGRFGLMMPKERPSPVRSQPVTAHVQLSPEQRTRMNENKAKAMARNAKRQKYKQ